jgi:hypothetical protein
MRMTRLGLITVVALSLTAWGEDKKLVGTKKATAPKLDLSLPAIKELPKGQLQKAKPAADQNGPSGHADEAYSVVRVLHGKSFTHSAEGAKPSVPVTQVTVSGRPLVCEPFTTVVRVKSPLKRDAHIEVSIVDPRGDVVMEAPGELSYRTGGDEAEWSVDWDGTSVRSAGDFQVLVRVAGNLVGTFPIKFAETPK